MRSHIYEAFAAIFLYRHHLVEAANSFMLYFISFCKHTILFGATLIFSKGQVFFNNFCLWHLLLVCSVVLFNTFDSSMDGVWYATLTLSSLSLVYYFWWWVSLCESWLDQISWHESHLWAVCVYVCINDGGAARVPKWFITFWFAFIYSSCDLNIWSDSHIQTSWADLARSATSLAFRQSRLERNPHLRAERHSHTASN